MLVVRLLGLGASLLLVLWATGSEASSDVFPTPAAAPTPASAPFVGSVACGACHEKELRLWRGSHHDRAMQLATEQTVLGDFGGKELTRDDVKSTFSRDGKRYLVRTQGPDGKQQSYEIAYTFGVTPLQQYLVAFPGGTYQALTTAWDSRPKEGGGQRWFDLYPDEKTPPGDVLHWTGPANNWNRMCAECHSTNLRSHYAPAERRYDTTWSEINVGCEACHGPGRPHVDWATQRAAGSEVATPNHGLSVSLVNDGAKWVMTPDRGIAQRDRPRQSHAEVESCAPCHSRRSKIADYTPGQPFMDAYRPALLDEGLYFADGQIDDEVYIWGSFVQSRMFHSGVSCSDCHDPHSGALKADGNALCATCHAPAKFDTPAHHHHARTSRGARCVECHMPARTYMVIDPRHDHSFRVPRPDLTVSLGVPNTCNGCHQERTPQWAAQTVATWSPGKRSPPHFAVAIDKGRRLGQGARDALLALLNDPTQPAIARATGLGLLPAFALEDVVGAVHKAKADDDALVRAAAVTAAMRLPLQARMPLLQSLLADPVRLVRLEAARALAPGRSGLGAEVLKRLDRGLEEYKEAQSLNADQPQAHLALAELYAELGMAAEAEQACRKALEVGPYFVPAYVNFADLYRAQGRDEQAESILRLGLERTPEDASLRHSLGLTLVRRGRSEEALRELQRAHQIEPGSTRFTYVYAIALSSLDRRDEAMALLRQASEQHPAEADLLIALATMYRDAGKPQEALHVAEHLLREWPSSDGARKLRDNLRPQKGG